MPEKSADNPSALREEELRIDLPRAGGQYGRSVAVLAP